VWDANPDVLIASSIALAAGRGKKVDDGFVVSGHWPFSSGVDNSDWNMLAVTVYGDDGKTAVDWRLCMVPKTDYQIIDTWYAMGMVGTGSKDIEVKEIFVPERRALALTLCRGGLEHPGGKLNTAALFRVPIVASAGHPLSATALGGDIAEIKLAGFGPNAAAMVFTAIANLHLGDKPKGVILDLRGNGGGSPTEVARLLGGFVRGKIWSTDIDRNGDRTANHTDDTVTLLHQPQVVLTDRNCASACDSFSDAVKDLHIGTLVGTRTAGVVAGPAYPYMLDDGSLLGLPTAHTLGADGEIIDGIGVAPDYNAPVTPQALSTGHDPAVDKALSLLGN